MFPEMSEQEIQLLNNFSILSPENQKEYHNYLRYILLKQYRAEMHSQVLANPLLFKGLKQALLMCEREDTQVEEIMQKVKQTKYMYNQLVEKVYFKYADALDDFPLNDFVIDWGRIGFENVAEAAYNEQKDMIRSELEEMIHGYNRMTKKQDKRRIVAV